MVHLLETLAFITPKFSYFVLWSFHLVNFAQGVLPYQEVGGGGGGMDLTLSLEAKIWGKVQPSKRKTLEGLLPQDSTFGKESQFWGHI